MGWSFRRSLRFGLFRLNLSKSGIGYSVGVRGLRYGKDAKGRKYRALNLPGTGIYRRDYFPATPARPRGSWFAPPRIFLLAALFLFLLWILIKAFAS